MTYGELTNFLELLQRLQWRDYGGKTHDFDGEDFLAFAKVRDIAISEVLQVAQDRAMKADRGSK